MVLQSTHSERRPSLTTRSNTTMNHQVVSPDQVTVRTSQPPPGGYHFASPNPYGQSTVIIQQPSQMSQMGPRVWSSDLCSCVDDVGTCLLGTFCPLALACQLSSQLGESSCVPCCVPGAITVLRTKMRVEQNIQGSVMDDCCITTFCGQCALCQMSRELDYVTKMQQ